MNQVKSCTSGQTNARHRGSTVASLNPWGELIMKLFRKKRVMGSPPIIWLAEAQSSSFQWITRLQLWTSFHLRDRCFGSFNFISSNRWQSLFLSGFKREVQLLCTAKWADCVTLFSAECLLLGSCQWWLWPKCKAWIDPNLLRPLLFTPKLHPSPHLQ